MTKTRTIAAVLASALLVAGSVAAQKSPPASKRSTATPQQVKKDVHPPVDVDDADAAACRDCHEVVTPAVYENWFRSEHGVNNVLCVVCHGGFDNFMKVPPSERCSGCHVTQTESLQTPFMKGKTCYGCHPAHALSPHPESPKPDPGVPARTTTGGAQ